MHQKRGKRKRDQKKRLKRQKKRKIRIYQNSKGKYIQDKYGRKLYIDSQLSDREIITLLLKSIFKRRKNRKGNNKKEKKQDNVSMPAVVSSGTAHNNLRDHFNDLDFAIKLKREFDFEHNKLKKERLTREEEETEKHKKRLLKEDVEKQKSKPLIEDEENQEILFKNDEEKQKNETVVTEPDTTEEMKEDEGLTEDEFISNLNHDIPKQLETLFPTLNSFINLEDVSTKHSDLEIKIMTSYCDTFKKLPSQDMLDNINSKIERAFLNRRNNLLGSLQRNLKKRIETLSHNLYDLKKPVGQREADKFRNEEKAKFASMFETAKSTAIDSLEEIPKIIQKAFLLEDRLETYVPNKLPLTEIKRLSPKRPQTHELSITSKAESNVAPSSSITSPSSSATKEMIEGISPKKQVLKSQALQNSEIAQRHVININIGPPSHVGWDLPPEVEHGPPPPTHEHHTSEQLKRAQFEKFKKLRNNGNDLLIKNIVAKDKKWKESVFNERGKSYLYKFVEFRQNLLNETESEALQKIVDIKGDTDFYTFEYTLGNTPKSELPEVVDLKHPYKGYTISTGPLYQHFIGPVDVKEWEKIRQNHPKVIMGQKISADIADEKRSHKVSLEKIKKSKSDLKLIDEKITIAIKNKDKDEKDKLSALLNNIITGHKKDFIKLIDDIVQLPPSERKIKTDELKEFIVDYAKEDEQEDTLKQTLNLIKTKSARKYSIQPHKVDGEKDDEPQSADSEKEEQLVDSQKNDDTNPDSQKYEEQLVDPHKNDDTNTDADKQASGNKEGGLTDTEICEMMKNYKQFIGCYYIDEISKIKPPKNAFGIIVFKPWSHGSKDGHWTAIYIDPTHDKSIEYYDSFGNDAPPEIPRQLKKLIDRINPASYLKYKVNRIKNQRANSDTCGYMCMSFLKDRFNGKKFKDITGYSTVMKSEQNMKRLRKKIAKFGYI